MDNKINAVLSVFHLLDHSLAISFYLSLSFSLSLSISHSPFLYLFLSLTLFFSIYFYLSFYLSLSFSLSLSISIFSLSFSLSQYLSLFQSTSPSKTRTLVKLLNLCHYQCLLLSICNRHGLYLVLAFLNKVITIEFNYRKHNSNYRSAKILRSIVFFFVTKAFRYFSEQLRLECKFGCVV